MEEGAIKPKPRVLFSVGENVKVVDGPFADFNGVVEEVKPDKGKLRVLISIFGRATPVGWNLFRWSGTKQRRVKYHGEEGYRRDQTSDTGGPSESKPPVGPALGQRGVNIMEFCKSFNAATQSQRGMIIPVIITVYADRSFVRDEEPSCVSSFKRGGWG